MMFWTLPMRQMCHKAVCPCLTSPPQTDEDTCKCKARELAHKSDIDCAVWKDKLISEGVKGIQE